MEKLYIACNNNIKSDYTTFSCFCLLNTLFLNSMFTRTPQAKSKVKLIKK